MYENDEKIFQTIINLGFLVVLDSGIGDHIVFKSILPDLKNKYENITIACCYPFVFENENLISIEQVKKIIPIDNYNIYKFMYDNNWNDSLENAYRKKYL